MIRINKDSDEKTINVNTNSKLNDIHLKKKVSPNVSNRSDNSRNSPTFTNSYQTPVSVPNFNPNLNPIPKVAESDTDTDSDSDDFDLLANPEKKLPETEKSESKGPGIFNNWFGRQESESEGSIKSSPKITRTPSVSDRESYTPPPFEDTEDQHLSYAQIQKKKAYYLSLFDKLEKRGGVKLHRRYTMENSLPELKNEYLRLKTQLDMEGSVQFARKMLLGCVTGMEWLNNRYDPFRLRLNGWSEQVFSEIEENQYDEAFEELYEKYGGGPEMEPELKLLFLLGSSAAWFHLSKTMFSSGNTDKVMDTMKNDPQFMQRIVNEAKSQLRQEGYTQPPPQQQRQQQVPRQVPRQAPQPPMDGFGRDFMPNVVGGGRPLDPRPQPAPALNKRAAPKPIRPEMKGPSTNIDDVLKRLQESSESESSDSSGSESTTSTKSVAKSVTVKTTRGRGRGRGRGKATVRGRGRGKVAAALKLD